jgi:diguanylate cyclase (GGDEF)-like protein
MTPDNSQHLTVVPSGRMPSRSMVSRARADREASPARVRSPHEMTPLQRFGHLVRRHGLQLLVVLFAVAWMGNAYGHARRPVAYGAGAILAVTAFAGLIFRLQRARRGMRVPLRTDVTLALLAAQVVFATLQVTGDRQSTLYPLLYLVAAFYAVAPWSRRVSVALILTVIVENALRYLSTDALGLEWGALVVQSAFIGSFALLYNLILSARLWSSRVAQQQAVALRLREAEESARSLRLVVADRSRDQRGPADEDELARRLLLGAILEVERSVGSIIEGASLALGGHALALYWLSSDEATIELRDGRSPAGLLTPGPLPAGDGVLGSVLRHSQPVRQTGKIPGVNWYERNVAIRSVAAVPVIERAVDGTGYVRGVLLADRMEPEPFAEKDVTFLIEIARQISRAVEAERLVGELHRAKDAQDRLQRASEKLNNAATLHDVTRTAVQVAQELVPALDLIAITRLEHNGENAVHIVAAAEGARAKEVDGLVYDDNDGLVSQVVRVGAPLPPKPPAILERVKLFDVKLAGMSALRVTPLHAGGKVIGTLVTASKQRGALDGEARRRIEGLAIVAAGALSRALALEQVAALATTDGLTGIANRRSLETLGERLFREAARYHRDFSVIIADVDHFKKVNDGYGHAAGDEVLKGVAAILRDTARSADVVGRFGGEEFVLVLPNTNADGAKLFAERLRVAIERASFTTPGGQLHVSASFGVASFPGDGGAWPDLVAAADDALYMAKASGRNRVLVARPRQDRLKTA